ncbi:hypothetical protein LA429_10455 [Weissella cibaria]|uniref:hypothetical protein n=1 Tax=Weissella cibaria TaxID=137591 RepID=UPI001E553384|nr:hypothetical protein [Weissella cibaria]MCC6123129.1 hypothetical protein [Weissella cibaria]MCT0953872.1 hypothetical protein [Weissella cibaria]
MSNILEKAKHELDLLGSDDMQLKINKDIFEVISVIADQGHSGFSISYLINAVDRLAKQMPLTPLTGKDDEWGTPASPKQNNRYSSVFKDENGKAYDIEYRIFTDDGGATWYSNKDSREYIEFPYMPRLEPERVYLNGKAEE